MAQTLLNVDKRSIASRPTAAVRDRIPYGIGFLVCAGALLVGRWLQPGQLPIPDCTFLRVTGLPCAFCGTTRGFFLAAHGAWAEAFRESPLGVGVWIGMWGLLVWLLVKAVTPGQGAPEAKNSKPYARLVVYGVIGLVIANWIYRLAMGLK